MNDAALDIPPFLDRRTGAVATLETPNIVSLYDAACRAIADAKSVDQVKDLRDRHDAIRQYARQAKNKQLEIDAAEIRIRAERRLGEMISAQRETGGLNSGTRGQLAGGSIIDLPGASVPTLAEAGIDKHLADRSRKLAAVPETQFESRLEEWRGRIEQENERVTTDLLKAGEAAERHVRGTFGTGENEWHTPEKYLDAARDALGAIDLDPASSEAAQSVVRAVAHYTKDNDGLGQEWCGRIWLNPPYAQPLIADFVFKMVDERRSGRMSAGILLTHNYTDTAWFQEAARAADAICFTRGRVKFIGADGSVAAPTQGQAFFYFGDGVAAFAARFAEFGFVVRRLPADEV